MKKMFSLLFAVLLAALLAVPAYASSQVVLLMSTPGISADPAKQGVKAEELEQAIEAGEELIPADCKMDPDRITVVHAGLLNCDEEENGYATFKVWSTVNRTIGLFFLAEDSEGWVLLACNLGDIIESEFRTSGTYAIAVGW